MTLGSPTNAEARRFALVVGVREYPVSDKLTPLAFTELDADQLAATLKQSQFQVTLMTQTVSKGMNQERFNPNAALIRKQLRDLVGEPFLTREDCLLLILAGHGIQLPSRTSPENLTYYFCPADAQIDDLKVSEDVQPQHNLLPVQELYDTLKQSSAGVKLLVVDACRNDPNKVDNFRSANSVTRPPVPEPPGGMAALFSCSANQRAAEDPDLKHGVFSHFLIEALGGRADLDGDRQIDIPELHKYVGSRTYTHVREKYSTQQLPEFKGEIKGWAPLLSVNTSNPMPLPNMDKFAGNKPGDLWDKNSLDIKFRWCPPGTFKLGSPASEKDRNDNENQVTVTLSRGFWLGQHEVTQTEWKALMGTTIEQQRDKVDPNYTLPGTGDTRPMYYLSWKDAMEFCRKLTERERAANRLPTNWEYTLPTEAQWEYACRAGTTTATAFGDSLSSTQANFDGNYPLNGAATGEAQGQAVPAGSYRPNAWNLYDMHGNVWEWCRDWYTDQVAGGTDPEAVEQTTNRVLRGGSWFAGGGACRSAYRYSYLPGSRFDNQGFRVALVPIR